MTSDGPTFYPTLRYKDTRAAIDWLEHAFGFRRMMIHPDEGEVMHAELAFGTGVIMLGSQGEGPLTDALASAPKPRYNAPYVYVEDVDAQHAHAVAAGAEITRELQDTDYGTREFCARDPEGNEWSFGTYRPVPGA
jgi:uncharacterized glyoxalase superfamily protein PhnB